MSLITRQTTCPHPHVPERGAEAAALVGPDLRPLVEGAAGCSPYLAGLVTKEADWLAAAAEAPEAAAEAVVAGLTMDPAENPSVPLRQAKRRIALITALADLAGVWPLEEVTHWLTRLADAAAEAAFTHAIAHEIRRGKLPGVEEGHGGFVALAMGKMGAGELNYSSDIDLICLFDETRYSQDDYGEARAALIRATRKGAGLLNDITAEGYVFRTDLRLRPDPSVTPVCVPMAGAEAYYESLGRTWERAAYIKARAAAGDIAAGERFLDTLRPFVWRKHLDFAAIEDAHDMRRRIREHKGLGGPITLPGHDMKLGRGGIREIEFFTQTRQLIAGGRDPALRVRGTVEGLARLAAAGWIEPALAEELTDHYRFHRTVEHRLQMVNDAQTQDLPSNDEGFERLAAFMGYEVSALQAELHQRLEAVHEKTEDFFARETPTPPATEVGFEEETLARWTSYPALRSDRAEEIFRRVRPVILDRLSRAAAPHEALMQFDRFLAGLPAGVQLFSLFEANPHLAELMADICAASPALAEYLSRNASVFDGVIAGDFFAPWPGAAALEALLATAITAAADYEGQLNAARRVQKEWWFRIGVHQLKGLLSPQEAGAQYSDLADATLRALWPAVVEEFARKHGAPPGVGAVALGMGSLGAGRLHSRSDLDLILIYDDAGVEASDGKRPLASRPYYARLTQAMITAMTTHTAEGALYEVDMRLRPSGRKGPVATSVKSFRDYQMTEAWTWEHLALTRARPIAGAAALMEEVETIRRAVIAAKAGGAAVEADVAQMRARLAEAHRDVSPWDAKHGAGRLQDIELFGQTCALRGASPARRTAEQLEDAQLEEAAALFFAVQSASRLASGGVFDPEAAGKGATDLLLAATGMETLEALAERLERQSVWAAALITERLAAGV